MEYLTAADTAIASSSLAEVADQILNKGVVVDARVRVSLVGIQILAIEARGLGQRGHVPQIRRNGGSDDNARVACGLIHLRVATPRPGLRIRARLLRALLSGQRLG